jgi:catechol 2,3-dioxygenase-like lactoylglutathione lyase family enzyme
MEPRISFLTLGVSNFERSKSFYRDGLGFPLSSASKGDVAFFKTGGVILALYPTDKLAEDAHVPSVGSGFRGVTIAHNVRSRDEVKEVLALAAAAGATVTKPAQDTFWGGHGGYFSDPDGHLWEVVWNPFFPFAEDGSVVVP